MGIDDTGLGTIGRIDHAKIPAGITIKMHPHINDDILSYFRTGKAKHTDSKDITAEISRNTLMLMRAGKVFYHEEEILESPEGLQIFIGPQHEDDKPKVVFYDLNETDSVDQWRLLASPGEQTPLQFTSESWIYDVKITTENQMLFPEPPQENLTALLYIFQGAVTLNGDFPLIKEECAVIIDEDIVFTGAPGTELVLFYTNAGSNCYKGGMYSGNRFQV